MAMHKSEELLDVNALLIQEVHNLKIPAFAVGIHICEPDSPHTWTWIGNPRDGQLPMTRIDHSTDPAFIRSQIRRLVKRAKRQGYAIGIGHPHQITYQVLQEALPELEREVELVPVSRVVKIPG